MRILGIDPGTATTGYAVLETGQKALIAVEFGAIRTNPSQPLSIRLQDLYRQLITIIDHHGPAEMAVEELFFNRNTQSALIVGQARGVVLLAAADAGLVVAEYSPLVVKQAVVGYGRAEKRQVQEMVKKLLALPAIPRPVDAADAAAVAICHVYSRSLAYL